MNRAQQSRIMVSALIIAGTVGTQMHAHDILLEFKGAYFLPTNHTFRKVYHNGGAIWGPELTGRLYKSLYGFVSTDIFMRKGKSLGLCIPTHVTTVNIGLGLKYMVPFSCGDFYVGLGIMPGYLHTKDKSPYVISPRNKGFCGGIAKMGAYFDLPKSFVIDLFFNFSFANAKFKCNTTCNTTSTVACNTTCTTECNTGCKKACDTGCNSLCATPGGQSTTVDLSAIRGRTAHLNGCWFGVGIGYRWGSKS